MQYDVHLNPRGGSAARYLLDIQHDLLRDLDTRVVVPLVPADLFKRVSETLHPIFLIEGRAHVLLTHRLAAVYRRDLGKSIVNLGDRSMEIGAAVDLLRSGV
ncbi:plasmid maintenance protein CcdB [Aliidongia dinghuensis]|uniref:Toxin CcdB n=1 Tax=Aliidongia dinghuensis TaxID=1867774 RepID=A0A8J2YT00_9PROT|nr:CcdB family protein [Aliidongia dinghuensis]GGF16181.1 plasmid maintenance protein CcdB [Aliidongia dinghuensis]